VCIVSDVLLSGVDMLAVDHNEIRCCDDRLWAVNEYSLLAVFMYCSLCICTQCTTKRWLVGSCQINVMEMVMQSKWPTDIPRQLSWLDTCRLKLHCV